MNSFQAGHTLQGKVTLSNLKDENEIEAKAYGIIPKVLKLDKQMSAQVSESKFKRSFLDEIDSNSKFKLKKITLKT